MPKAKNLKYCRIKAGMTQEKLADALGVTIQTIRSWENKRTAIPVPNTHRLAEFFGVSYADFCDYDLEQRDAGGIEITVQEKLAIMKYRALPAGAKQMIKQTLDTAYEYMISQQIGS